MLEVVKKQTSKSDDSNYLVSMFFSENSTRGNSNSFRSDAGDNSIKWISPSSKEIAESIKWISPSSKEITGTTVVLLTDAAFFSGFNSHTLNEYNSDIIGANKTHSGYFFDVSNHQNICNYWRSHTSHREDEYKDKIRRVLSCVKSIELRNEREASKFLMKDIEHSLKIRELTYLNELLSNLTSYDLNPRSMVSALRSTYRAKSKLPIWGFALSFVEEKISAKGLNSRSWLIGLINEKN